MIPEKFIQIVRSSFLGSKFLYRNGSCYHFYRILKAVYPEAHPYWNDRHVITKIGKKYYDITGEVSKKGYIAMKNNDGNTSDRPGKKGVRKSKYDIFSYPYNQSTKLFTSSPALKTTR